MNSPSADLKILLTRESRDKAATWALERHAPPKRVIVTLEGRGSASWPALSREWTRVCGVPDSLDNLDRFFDLLSDALSRDNHEVVYVILEAELVLCEEPDEEFGRYFSAFDQMLRWWQDYQLYGPVEDRWRCNLVLQVSDTDAVSIQEKLNFYGVQADLIIELDDALGQ